VQPYGDGSTEALADAAPMPPGARPGFARACLLGMTTLATFSEATRRKTIGLVGLALGHGEREAGSPTGLTQ
jgi:hypothetical protein